MNREVCNWPSNYLAMQEKPTGLCITNDFVALSFMVEVMKAGVNIPRDVSVIGCENQRIAAFCPVPLTSVTQPTQEIVQAVTKLLVSRLEGDTSPPRTVTVCGQLIERESVGSIF